TLTINANTFEFSAEGASSLTLAVSGTSMSLMWFDTSQLAQIKTTYTSAPFDVGVVPLSLGGQWTFASTTDSENCTASLGGTAFNASCTQVEGTPFGTLNGTVVGQRTQALPSIFGDFGGQWHLTTSRPGQGPGSADVTISGNSFVAVAPGSGIFSGAV